MKNLLLALLCLCAVNFAFAARTTAHPFQIELSTPKDHLSIKAQLIQSCRYEKIVWSDSAEYHTETKKYDLEQELFSRGDEVLHVLSLRNPHQLEVRGVFKPTKECLSFLEISFIDKKYSVGWAGQTKRPLSFSLSSSSPYNYQEGESELNITSLSDLISHKKIQFLYRPVSFQVNIWLLADGEKLPVSPTTSAIDPRTGMPYLLQ
jgi:hypothetical protein